MKVVPLGQQVIVKRLPRAQKSTGGIVFPVTTPDGSQQGRVLSVGDGRLLGDGTRVEPQVTEGDRILFSTDTAAEFVVDGEPLFILNETEILAVVG